MTGRFLRQSLVLLAVAACGALATRRWHPLRPELYLAAETAGPGEITVAEALALARTKGVIWLDARPRAAFEAGHIPGAHLLNLYEWDDLMPEIVALLDADGLKSTVVIYCDGQKCAASRELKDRMNELPLGEIDIRVLTGGWPAWQAAMEKQPPE